jgi:hypothetical protein
MSKPVYEFTFDDLQILDQMKIYFLASCMRAMGSNTHKFNERIILGGQINQVVRSNTENFRESQGGGFFGKLKNIF